MKERPILFSAPMVRAILAGHKTQTRRIIKLAPSGEWKFGKLIKLCPYGLVGHQFWVRETFSIWSDGMSDGVFYRATDADKGIESIKWKPSIFMPRWASRIQLEIVAIRVERLQDISESDVVAEGIASAPAGEYGVAAYRSLWNKLNGDGSWTSNPWVWVIEFKRLKP
jgi:hypothetical protein